MAHRPGECGLRAPGSSLTSPGPAPRIPVDAGQVPATTSSETSGTGAQTRATLTWAVVDHPAHGTLTLSDEVLYVPHPDFHGEDRFTYAVSDGQMSSGLAAVNIHVKHVLECGDREIEGAETCDDGNTTDGDGCSAACTSEGFAP